MTVNLKDYPLAVRSLTAEEGGGFLCSFPDFNDCCSDGETMEEAIENGYDALKATIEALEAEGYAVPAPNSYDRWSGKFMQRVPKRLHAKLARAAKMEGVSMNALIAAVLAEYIGEQEGRKGEARRHWRKYPNGVARHDTVSPL